MFTAPFNPITGIGLGVSYSSLNQIGGIFPQKGIGQANVLCFVNMINGNLIIKDHMVKLMELNGPMELGFYFNTQVTAGINNWQFAIKKLILPINNQTVTLQEKDGHLTSYTSTGNNVYTAPALNDGTPYLTKLGDGTWQWYHPKTQITEIYNANGLLTSVTNARCNTTEFIYDVNNNLTNINGSGGDTYQITRTSTNIYIYDTSTGNNNLLQSYTLDSQGRIITTQTPDGYQINYFYSSNTNGNYINKIMQSDGTSLQFNNNISATFGNQVTNFQLGTDVNYNFTYPTAQNPNTAIVTDGMGATTTITLDQNNRTTQIAQQTGFDVVGNEIDLTTVAYNSAGQVQSITKPEGQLNNQSTSFQYGIFGLMTQKTDPNGQITQFNYYNDVNCAVPTYLISKSQTINNQNLTTYYIYNTNYDGSNYIFQQFMISPTGRVTQYQPDYDGNIEYISQFFNTAFNTANLNPTTPTPLQQLTTWTTQQFAQNLPQQASLLNYEYDSRGQISSKVEFANTDGQGNGIADAFASQEGNYWDEFGNLTQHEFLQIYPATTAITTQRFDGLQRLTKNINALLEVTTHNYLDAQSQIQTIYPNNATDTKTNEPSGLVNNDTATAMSGNNQNQSRITNFARDNAGRTIKTTLPDGNLLYTFYDRQNRLSIKISPAGIFSQTQYDRVHNYTATTTYANAIDTTKLVNASNPNTLPTASLALSLLTPDPLNDRTTYQFKDASNRIIWEIDGKNYGTQYFYDALNRNIAKVTYTTQLTSAELTQLKQAQAVVRTPDFSQDRGVQYFYDNDNNKIGKLVSAGYKTATTTDATGYLTQYFRDSASRIFKITRYATRVALNLANNNLSQFIPAADPINDATTYVFRDARGNKIATVDAVGYLTLFTNLPCGIPAQSIRYANKIAANWFANPTTIPPTPASSTEDQTTIYDYDLLNRPTETTGAMNRSDSIIYDVMGNKISLQTQDENNPNSVDPSCMRGTQTQFDGWKQKTSEANAYVNQLIENINSNSNLTQQQKDQQIAQVWQTQSMRHTYDATGLKLFSIMPPRQNSNVNDIYYYYYDVDRRPVVIVDPNGNVTIKTLNSFGETTQTRLFANAIAQQTLSTLTGGFITSAFQLILNGLQNAKDEITNKTYDQRGQITQIVDANNNTTTKTYTAFKQVATENLPVANQQPSLTITHQYEGRGYEIQTTKTGGTLSTTTNSQFSNLNGKKTQYTDELNTNYNTQYDPLGRAIVKQEISASDNLTITTHTLTIDAFGRVLTDTDSQQQVTTHSYNQQNRTHTITYPINAVTKIITLNIFNQKIQIVDSLSDTEKWQYAPDGKIAIYTDQLNNVTTDNFDLMGRNILHIDANNIQTSKTYDDASHLIKIITDVTGLALITQFVPDAFGNNLTIIDPRNIITANTFDGNNNLIQSIIDPNNPGQNYTGLNIIKAKTYNAQNLITSYTLGDATTNNQYYENDQIDSLNRPIGKTVDPNNLVLVTAQHLDAAGEVIANIDANGNITRTFFDGLKRKRFVVDAAGGVYERNYDTENRLIYERHYDNGITPTTLSDSTTLQQLIALVQSSAQDSYIYYFYDNNGNECFTVNSIGRVSQKIYDNAGRKIQDTIYVTPNTTTVTTLITSSLITWAAQQNNNIQNQTTYHILDAKGQECFTINPNKIISQTVFDPNGNKIIQVTYANAVNPSQIIVLPLNQILANITQDNTRDRYTYKILDNLQRPIFEVDGEGNVTKHVYDGNNNETIYAKYAQKITVPQTYANIVAACNALPAPNPAVDSITQKIWDNANRNTIVKDPINNTDQFQLTVSGNVKIHTDKNNQQWTNNFDTANRLTDQYTPQVPITVVPPPPPSNKSNLLNENNDKIISSLLTQNKNPQYPIINLAGLGNDCALFALALAAKKAVLKDTALQNSLFHWPLIAQINEIDIAKKSARNAKIGHYLRIALVKALLQDEAFKKQQYVSFISFCATYLDTQNRDIALPPLTNLIESNQTFINQMQMAWQKKISDQSKSNNKQAVSTKITQSFIEIYINANGGWSDVYQRYCEFIQNEPTKFSIEEIACLANYWKINLSIIQKNGNIFKNKQSLEANQIKASLCYLDAQHWQVIDISAKPLNDGDAYNPSNLAYKVRTKDGINNTVIPSPITLTSTQSNQSVHKQFVLDKVGNKINITEGKGTSQERTIINDFTPINKLLGTTINNVPVDNPTAIASYQTPPVSNVNLTTKITYNAKQKKVAEQNENGQWQFYIYDSEKREVYRVSTMSNNGTISGYAVTQKIYDVFNNVIQENAYYAPINLNLTQYILTGIPLSVIQQAGVIVTSPNDRTVTKTYDNCNNITLLQQGPIFYYLPNANGSNPQFGTSTIQTKFAYTAFNQCYFKSVLLNPQQNTWSQQLFWFDRTSKLLAECDPVYRVKIHQYDAFKNEVLRVEWGGQPSQLPTATTTYSQLIAAYNWTATDRVYSYTYDVRQLKLSETRAQKLTANTLGVITQSLTLGNNNVPSLQNQTVNGLTKYFTYTAALQLNSIKDEAGYLKYIFYDARNIVIATTDVPRTSVNGNNQSITLVPLTYTGNDLFGKPVTTTRFKQGTVPVTNPLQLPQPIATDPDDQIEYTCFDVRGLATWKQDADKNVTGFTYTPTRKKARNFNQLTNKTAINIDDYRITYDALDRVTLKTIYRNGTLQTNFQTQIQYDPFNQPIAEGDGLGNWPLYRKFDAVGNIWSTNKDGGVATIILTDLTGKVSLRGQSATQDLSQINYSNLTNLMALGINDLERLQSQRDNSGRVVVKNLPSFSIDDPFSSKNLPLTFIASNQYPQIGSYTLTWQQPYETLVGATQVVLTATADNHKTYTLNINPQNNGSIIGVDVSQVPSDVYNYEMKFYALAGQQTYGPELYHSKGTVQFNNNNYSNSLSMVVEVQNGSSLLLSGYTRGITAVQLMQNNSQIAQVPVQSVPHSQDNFTANLSSYASGVYTVIPVIPGKNNLPQTMPFSIYTNTPSPTPLAQEIPCQITLYTLFASNGQRAQLAWTVPNQFSQLSVTMTCNYQDTNNINRVQQVTIAPGTNLGVYTDSRNNRLTCNNNFAYQINKILNVTVSLQLSANESFIIVNNFTPKNPAGNNTTVIQTNNFNNSIIQYMKPLTGFSAPPTISYLDTTRDRAANYVNLTAIQANAFGIVLDTSALPIGYFPFNVTIPGAQPVTVNSLFTVTHGTLVFPGKNDIPNPPIVKNPSYQFSYDNWNNQLYQINTLNNKTSYINNIDNKTTQVTQPAVDVLNEDGSTNTNITPITITGFDIRSNRIGMIRPNGNAINNPINNTEGFQLDEAAQMVADVLADGTYADRNVFDALGRITTRITKVDGNNYQYVLVYDHRNNVIQETYPTGSIWRYAYNEINRRYLQTDPSPESIYYDYDFNANISANYLPGGEVTTMDYDRNHKTIKIKYPTVDNNDNMSQFWYLDYFGDPLPKGNGATDVPGHSDIAGVNYYYVYDFKRQVIKKKSATPSSVAQHGQYLLLTPSYNISTRLFQYSANVAGPLKQDLEFTYQRGLVVQAIDYANNKVTLTSYDSENRRIAYSLWGSSNVSPQFLLRELNSQYDAIGRETVTTESQAKIEKYYDLNSNIRRQRIRAKVQGYSLDSDTWSTFDVTDRILIFNGIFDKNSNKIIINKHGGWQYTYKDGFRDTQTYISISDSTEKSTIKYDHDGRLSEIDIPAQSYYATYGFDKVGRLQYFTSHANNAVLEYNQTNFNNNGWISGTTQSYSTDISNVNTTFGTFYPDGQPSNQTTTYVQSGIKDTLDTIQFALFDDFQLMLMGGNRYIPSIGTSNYSSTQKYFDSNGIVSGQSGINCSQTYNHFENQYGTSVLITSYDGLILSRYELLNVNAEAPTSSYNITQFIYDNANNAVAVYTVYYTGLEVTAITSSLSAGHRVNRYGTQLSSYNSQAFNGTIIGNLLTSTSSNTTNMPFFSPISNLLANSKIYNQMLLKNSLFQMQQTLAQTCLALDIVRPIDQSYPATGGASYYTVQPDDNLDVIAMSQYGDATKATDIANANNIFDGQVAAGQVLVIPPIINSRYQASSALPYAQFMNTVLMSMYPQFKFNPPKQHDGFLSEVVHTLVDVAAQIVGMTIGAALGGPIGAAIGAAIATGLADAGYQDLAVHEGWQPHFSLKESVTAGIEAGIETYVMEPGGNFGLNNVATTSSTAISTGSSVTLHTSLTLGDAIRNAGEIAVLDQLTEMALGERNKFDFNAVITSMTSAAAMYYVGSAEQELPVGQFPDDVIQSFTGNIIQSASYDTITGQTLYMDQIAASSLGATLGQYIGNEIINISKANESSTNPANPNNQNGNNAQNNSTTGNNGLNNSSSSASGNNSGNNNSASSGNNSANNYTNYQSSQNPGNNQSGFFNSGNANANLSSNNASQNYSANNASGSSYGSGNSSATSKVNNSTTSDSGSMNYVPFPKLSDSPQIIAQALINFSNNGNQSISPSNFYDPSSTEGLTFSQESILATLEGIDKTAGNYIAKYTAIGAYASSTARQASQLAFNSAAENFFNPDIDDSIEKNIITLNNVVENNTAIAEDAATNTRGLSLLQGLGTIANVLNVGMRIDIVENTPPGQRTQVAFEQTYEFVMEGVADLGVTIGVEYYTAGFGTFVVLVPALVATNQIVGPLAQQKGDDAYNSDEQNISSLRSML